jgi:hypothetical protein
MAFIQSSGSAIMWASLSRLGLRASFHLRRGPYTAGMRKKPRLPPTPPEITQAFGRSLWQRIEAMLARDQTPAQHEESCRPEIRK